MATWNAGVKIMTKKDIILWTPNLPVNIPNSVREPVEIIQYAKQLTNRDVKQIVQAFNAESYEMVSTFVLTKAMAILKKQLAELGMEFIGEMLGRPELEEYSNEDMITHYEAISLAQDLGMTTSTEAMRLKQTLATVTHFASLEDDKDDDDEGMNVEEAIGCLRNCIKNILGKPKIEAAVKFAEFRYKLEFSTFKPDDTDIINLQNSAYFFHKTTLNILLSLLKKSEGAQLEHAIGNINTIIPLLWNNLRKAERWQTGQTYAFLISEGNKTATVGLKKALIKVQGFDYVPETLRSDTYIRAANKVLEAHEGFDNFYNEPSVIRALSNLGTTIPMPAFSKCLTATLAVRLGNPYGISNRAQSYALDILKRLSENQWIYYLNECLPSDRIILEKIAWYSKPLNNWINLVGDFNLDKLEIKIIRIKNLINASKKANSEKIKRLANNLL